MLVWCGKCGHVLEFDRWELINGTTQLLCATCGDYLVSSETLASTAAAARMGLDLRELVSMMAQLEPLV